MDSMSERIPNWESIVHKNARSSDGVDVGNVAEVDDKNLILIQGAVHENEYNIPHATVEEFDGAEVRLNITRKEIQKYLVK